MNVEWVRRYCMALPRTTEQVQWGHDLVFKIGGKMYAAVPLEPERVCLTFKTTPEEFAELCERAGIFPAPYVAKAKWVALESWDALAVAEMKRLLKQSYDLVFAKLPKKLQAELSVVSDQPSVKGRRAAAGRAPVRVRASTRAGTAPPRSDGPL